MLLVPLFRGLARHLHLACLALTVATATALAQTNTPSAADGYDPNIDGHVYAMVKQESDGKLIVVGQFNNIAANGSTSIGCNYIARLNTDGSVDSTFNPDVDGPIRAVALQADGRVIIGGDFTKVGGEAHNQLARLNANGSVDTSFKAGVAKGTQLPKPQVLAVAVQPGDGSIVVGGTFGSAVSSTGTALARMNLARFSSAGVVDPTYDPNPNAMVLALAVHQAGKLLVGGAFTEFKEAGKTVATARLHVARLETNGTLDQNFNPQANDGVTTFAVQPDGKILLGGYFTTLTSANESRNHLARLNLDGSLDADFKTSVAGNVFALTLAPDGGILVGGHFTQVYNPSGITAARGYAAKLAQDGTLDDAFNPGVNADVYAIVVQSDGKVVVGGAFTRAQPPTVRTAVVRNHIARVLPNGALDTSFQLDPGGRILASVTQPDGKIVVAGSFTNIGGLTRNYVARLNADGSVDTSYNPNLDGPVYALAYHPSSKKVLLGGAFTNVASVSRNHIARLNEDGSLDTSFDPNINGPVGSIILQGENNILVGGSFTTVHPANTTDDVARYNLLRLTTAGQVDTVFNPSPNAAIAAIALQSDGKIIIAGSFSALQPGATGDIHARNYITRLTADGAMDGNFNPGPNYPVSAIAIQPDNKVVIGGSFTAFYPPSATAAINRNYIARINADGSVDTAFDPHANSIVLALAIQDGKVLVGGPFTSFQPGDATVATPVKYFGRLLSDGKVDTTYNVALNELGGNRVDSIAVQPNGGDVLFGGSFTSVNGVLRNRFARLTSSGTLTAFNPGAGGSSSAQVKAIALQTDGKVVVAGNFSDLGGAQSTNVARFNPEGTPDAGFNAALSTDGTVNALAIRANGVVQPTQLNGFAWLNNNGDLRSTFRPSLNTRGRINASVIQPDGKVILAGLFTDLSGQASSNIVRFNTNNSVDTSFAVTVDGSVYAMALQPDGKLILVGSFTSVNGTTRNRIARINTNGGGLDVDFDPNADSAINSVVVQNDGAIVLGGSFTTLTAKPATTAVSRNYIARVDKNGALDSSYNPNLNGPINALALDSSGRVVAGGLFTTTQPNSDTSATTRNRIARFETTGNVDKNFDPNANEGVNAIVIQSDQKILIGGSFTTLQPTIGTTAQALVTRNRIARLGTDGAVDADFSPGTNSLVTSMALGAGNSILVGGFFNTATGTGSSTAIARNHFVRFSSTGALDAQFNPDIAGNVGSITVAAADGSLLVGGSFTSLQPTGLILLGGNFKNVGGLPAPYLAQLNGDGSVNAAFQPAPNQQVAAVLPLPDGRFVVGGSFTTIAGSARAGLARFNADAALDSSFAPSLTGGATALALQSDGKVLVGAGTELIRINADGSRDTSFTAAALFAPVVALAVQADGKIVVAGPGSGIPTRILRLNSNGTADTTFPTVSFTGGTDIETLTLQADGSMIVAGSFTSIGGTNISRLARLKSNGTVDTSFNPVPNGTVTGLALQSDGRLLIGGSFISVGGLQRSGLARLGNTGASTQTLNVSADGKTVTWLRQGGTAAELAAVSFEVSTDGSSWQKADSTTGLATRIGSTSGWQLTNATVPTSGNAYIRARGIAPTSAGKSAGVYETVRMVNLSSPVPSVAMNVGPVVSSVAWDQSHYVWTVDAAGVLRISDSFSGFVLENNSTALIEGGPARSNTAASGRLADLSTRGTVNANSPLISGFAISGTGTRTVLVRAIGPGLTGFGVADALSTPQLRLFNNTTGALIGLNNGWNNDPALAGVFVRTGAFPLTPGSADAALVITLNPGAYSVQVIDGSASAKGGNALVEIYDAGSLADSTARLMNLSSRGTVSDGQPLIGGLVITGSAKTLLVRGVGPALAKYGVGGVLGNPAVSVYDSAGRIVVSNEDWQISNQPTIPELDFGAAITSAAASVGAFGFDSGSKDAALIVTLPAGAYTVQVNGQIGTAGAAMIEVYELQ